MIKLELSKPRRENDFTGRDFERAEVWFEIKGYPIMETTLALIQKDIDELRAQKECWYFQEEWEQFGIERSIADAENAYDNLYSTLFKDLSAVS